MQFRLFHPIPQLAEYIQHFWTIRAPAPGSPRSARMPADARGTLLLSFAGNTHFVPDDSPDHSLGIGAGILGPRRWSSVLEHDGETDLIAAQFRPGGMASFFDCSIRELSESTTPLELLWGKRANRLLEQIYDARTPQEKILVYQKVLAARIREWPDRHRISKAFKDMDAANEEVHIAWFAEQVCLSQKHLERLFERRVGITPKLYCRIVRFQKMVSKLERQGKPETWTALAAEFGYYDHSHMLKDFRAFVGATPSEFVAATAGIAEVVYA
jgi:AraC-like DNA-binding protein